MQNTAITEKIGKLGFGYMRLPTIGDKPDIDQVCKMADAFLESGGTYFDAAYIYEDAEEALRDTVLKRYRGDRDKIQVATKVSMHMIETHENLVSVYETQLERLGGDRIDFYLLHGINSMTSKKAEDLGAWGYLSELKSQGAIKHMGFSYHGTADDLDEILAKHPETEFVQLQINYLDWDNPQIMSRRLHEVARKHNIPIVIMEPVRGGLLASEASPVAKFLHSANPDVSIASWAMRFAAQQSGVLVTLSGMTSMEQMTDNIATFSDLKPLTADESAILDEAVKILNSVPRIDCTDCHYCVKGCPSNILIPKMIDLLNDSTVHKTLWSLSRLYGILTRRTGKASDCTACRACEEICPQKLDIVDAMAQVTTVFE